jgi:hypothetical protein
VRFAVGVVVAHLGDVTLGVLENELEACHRSCSLARPGRGGQERSGREEELLLALSVLLS